MNKFLIFAASILILSSSFLLNAQEEDKGRTFRTISVTGVAEKEIAPDIIYFTISLKEYKLGAGSKFEISELENQLISAVEEEGIDKQNLQVENVYGYNYSWNKRDKNKDFMARKQFRLKLSNAKKLNNILSKVDPKAIEYARVSEYTHSKIRELNLELQVEAVQNARAKAEALLKPLNETVGKALEISETNQNFKPVYYKSYQQNRMLSVSAEESQSTQSNLDFKDIKLSSEIHIVFLIQ